MGVVGLDHSDCLIDCVFLEQGQVERNHLRRSVDACRAMDIHLLSLLYQLPHHLHSSLSLTYKIIVVHIQDRVLFVPHSLLLADKAQVVRSESMALEVLLTLYREDS